MIQWLPAQQALSQQIAGGKASTLATLFARGFDVPEFVVLTSDAFDADDLTSAMRGQLAGMLATIAPGPFAVRSSGREEDSADHSHAGQFLTLLNVADEDVGSAAREVWMSGAAESVQHYRKTRGLPTDGGKPAVIVQRMVRARAAGICFSADPVSGRRDRIVISAIAGLADALVGGQEDGQSYVVDSNTSAIIERPATDPVLTDDDVAALVDLARRVQVAQGAPQDIEWAFEGERLFLLQARPITTTLRGPALADRDITIFDNSNIVESYPGLVSPLTYSFAQYAYARVYRMFVALIGVPQRTIRANAVVFDNMLGRIDGHIYYNLINWYRALSLLPGFANNRAHMEAMMGVGAPLPDDVSARLAPPPVRGLRQVMEYTRIAKMAALLLWQAAWLPQTRTGFYRRLSNSLKVTADAVNGLPLTALAAEYRRIEAELLDQWDAPLVNDFLCMIAFGASRKLIEQWAGQPGLQLHNSMMIGQGDIISAEPAKRIGRMGNLARGKSVVVARLRSGDRTLFDGDDALAAELRNYVAKFGDRCTEELKLESITLYDDPTSLLAAIAAAATGEEKVAASFSAEPLTDLSALFRDRPVRAWLMRPILTYAKSRVRDRENLRFERTRIFGHARRVFIAMGRQFHAHGQIDAPRDIFLLTVQEVLGAIEGFGVTGDLRGLIATRRAEMEAAAAMPEPLERITIAGAAITRSRAVSNPQATQPSNNDLQRSATGCSAGVKRGIARIIADPRKQILAHGDILVSRHTDPGWIAVFSNAAAMVVERGSLLSHSAIVAREMGIPCVVGLKDATRWIADGDIIEVDGSSGSVRKIDG